MKKLIIATGALLIGTSALAWQPASQPVAHDDKGALAEQVGAKAAETPLVAKANALPKELAGEDLPAKGVETAAATADPKVSLASSTWGDDPSVQPKPVLASAATFEDDGLAPKDEDAAKTIDTAEGDPNLDLSEQPAADDMAALAPRPATGNYPACSPGPGDDNCIQLYEPGVQTALASWTQPTGGLAGDTQMASAEADTTLAAEMGEPPVETAMGGPYEPVDEPVDASADLASNGDGATDWNAGETADTELAAIY